jgi:hypothetical protein
VPLFNKRNVYLLVARDVKVIETQTLLWNSLQFRQTCKTLVIRKLRRGLRLEREGTKMGGPNSRGSLVSFRLKKQEYCDMKSLGTLCGQQDKLCPGD